MVPEKYRLAAVGRFLLEQFELRRPGFREWSPQVEASLRQDAEGELQLMEKQLRELGVDDAGYWQRVRRALDGFILGIICVEVPYIPIQAKWFPALLLVLGPLFPDAVMWLHRRRWRRRLEALVADLHHASETLDTYRPLSELSRAPRAARERG